MSEHVSDVDRLRGHSLFPTNLDDRVWLNDDGVLVDIPPMYGTEGVLPEDKIVRLHYFCLSADWWIVELDQASWTGFGFANLGDPAMAEWGYIDLSVLAAIKFPMEALAEIAGELVYAVVERDLHWSARRFSEVGR